MKWLCTSSMNSHTFYTILLCQAIQLLLSFSTLGKKGGHPSWPWWTEYYIDVLLKVLSFFNLSWLTSIANVSCGLLNCRIWIPYKLTTVSSICTSNVQWILYLLCTGFAFHLEFLFFMKFVLVFGGVFLMEHFLSDGTWMQLISKCFGLSCSFILA